jgi:hypothetical protein
MIQEFNHKEVLIQSYQTHGDFKRACFDAKLSALVGYKILKMNKVLKINDSLKMGSAGAKQGALYEKEFMRLVPKALPINDLKMNNPKFDFVVNDFTVDVKSSSLVERKRPSGNIYREWHAKMSRGRGNLDKGADFYAFFCIYDDKKTYDLYLVPSELVQGTQGITINQNNKESSAWVDFKIDPNDLAQYFDDLVDGELSDVFLKEKNRTYFKVEVSECKKLISKIKRTVNEKHS